MRAPRLCSARGRADLIAQEFTANHPAVRADLAELAVAGFDTQLYYHWPMTRLIAQASRAVGGPYARGGGHAPPGSPGGSIDQIRLGHGVALPDDEKQSARARARSRARAFRRMRSCSDASAV